MQHMFILFLMLVLICLLSFYPFWCREFFSFCRRRLPETSLFLSRSAAAVVSVGVGAAAAAVTGSAAAEIGVLLRLQ